MTSDERDIITRFIARVGGTPAAGFGSVPGTQPASLPPVDPEADRLIAEQFNQHPEARYRITQMAFVQEAALAEAQNRIQRLQWELQQAQSRPQGKGGLFGGLFGGGGSQQGYNAPPPPQPQYAPGMAQPGMFQQGGNGFLGSALRTATGVAGGMLAAEAITSLFSGHHGGGFGGGFGGGGGFGAPVNETVNNYYGDGAAQADPWGGAGTTPDQGGYWSKDDAYNAGGNDPGWGDAGQSDGGGWSGPSSDPGWGDGGGSDDSGW